MKTLNKSWIYTFMLIGALIFIFSCGKDEETTPSDEVTDVDGNVYNTVTIGNQVWLAENLKVTKLSDGDSIPNITGNDTWSNLQTPGLCWYDNNESGYKNVYGPLYNWHTVETDKLCPSGWHIPTIDEWEILYDYLGDSAGSKLKETGNTHWSTSNKDANNITGFTALPGGYRIPNTGFRDEGIYGYWWSATSNPNNNTNAFARELNTYSIDGSQIVYNKSYGMSVRCIKD